MLSMMLELDEELSMVTYLVPLIESWFDQAVVLRGAASKAWTTLKIDQPGQLPLFWGGLDGFIEARYTPREESQRAIVGLAVIDRDIEEPLSDSELA